MIKDKDIKAVREMLNEWSSCPLMELSIGVLHRHPLPWAVEERYHGYDIVASDGVDVGIAMPEKTAHALVLWAQEVVKASERATEKSRKFREQLEKEND